VGLAPASGEVAQRGGPEGKAFQQQDVEVQLHHEEPIISKQVESGGQVVVQIQNELQHTNVQGQIRHEQVQVTKQGNSQNATISPELANPSATWEAKGGGGEAGGQGRGPSASAAPITDPASLTAISDPGSMAGRSAKFSNLKVEQVIGDHL